VTTVEVASGKPAVIENGPATAGVPVLAPAFVLSDSPAVNAPAETAQG